MTAASRSTSFPGPLHPARLLGLTILCFVSVSGVPQAAIARAAVSHASLASGEGPRPHTMPKVITTRQRVAGPTVVQSVRVRTYPEFLRLVLDLQRSVIFTQSRHGNERVVIELQNSLLGKAVKTRLTSGELPDHITIAQPHPRSVTISLALDAVRDYRLLPLTKPARLVLDVYTRAPEADAPKVDMPASQVVEERSPSRPTGRAAQGEIKTIVIDPGHGGKDPGAIGRAGAAEKDITLQVGLMVRDLLAKRLGKRVLLTRDKDVFVDLEDRAQYANSINADLFVSIHVNSHPQRATRGVEIYHFGEATDRRALEVAARENGTPIKDTEVGWQYLVADLLTTKKVQESLELAWTTKQAMLAQLDDHYDVVDHGVKTAPFYVLRYTAMPSILTEIAFISNPTEERLMQSDRFLARMAEAIFEGVKAFIHPVQTASR
jgi:N-acetylmuramoyl-L-alanine amidase